MTNAITISAIKLLSLFFLLGVVSCKKDCTANQQAGCTDVAPTNELCLAYFERWFYDDKTDACEKIAYSGCSDKGFTTQTECEACKCK